MEINPVLAINAGKGDTEAFGELYNLVYKDLYRYAYYMLKDSEDAKDVVSDTFFDAYKNIKKLRDPSLFKNWIFKILFIKCKRKLRQYTLKTFELKETETKVSIDFEENYDLKKAFDLLCPLDKNIVFLIVFAGYNSRETGKILHMKDNTIRSRLSRALSVMRIHMEG